jgi:hypothetical protein
MCKDTITIGGDASKRFANFTFTTPFIISAGTQKVFRVRVDSSVTPFSNYETLRLNATLDNATDVNWGDGVTANGLAFETPSVPFSVASNLSY